MHDLQACIACLRTDVKIFHMSSNHIREDYNLVSGLKTCSGEGLPEYMCMECLALVKGMKSFRDKCHRSHFLLHEILKKNKQITLQVLNEINLQALNITPKLSYLSSSSRKKYEKIKFKWKKDNRSYVQPIQANVLLHSTVDNEINPYIEIEVPECKLPPVFNIEDENINNEIDVSVETDPKNNEDYDYVDNEIEDDIEIEKEENDVDGSNLDVEYAVLVPMTKNEAAAVIDIFKTYGQTGKHECDICGLKFHNKNRLDQHRRMHDTHINGNFSCDLCHYYYKTKFLLDTHITDKHMYKYICRKCPEVTYNRKTAKQHYILSHMDKADKTFEDWYDTRPSWLKKRSLNGRRPKKTNKHKKNVFTREGFEFLKYSPISHNEQYSLVLERKNSKNYVESMYKCELCYKGFREEKTYEKHMQKHDPSISGKYQCDLCKIHCAHPRKMYKHMIQTHLYKFTCTLCTFVTTNRPQAKLHYLWHKDVTYPCPHCDKVFKKMSTQLTHIRIKHPSLFICNLCGHSFVSEAGLICHKRITHQDEGKDEDDMKTDAALFCALCNVQFKDEVAYTTHLGSSGNHAESNLSVSKTMANKNKKVRAARNRRTRRQFPEVLNNGIVTETNCEICDKLLLSDVQARRHYETDHPGAEFRKRFMCDICGHTTRQYSNLLTHMRTHTREKPFACPHCERRFSMPSNRDRHIVVHTGEKPHECPHCFRRFSQRTAMKLHVQTVHLKIPYAPWNKNNRRRRQKDETETASTILTTMVPAKLPTLTKMPIVTETHDYLNAYISYNE
ncbi:zinc finger protein 84-like [Aricia agestis]|uniref:zinc finger protein 84-like n=1 Tax=Aricia agestis TaxID=91739 RepID=UPI001C2029F6|nr:zinc finger protein 84-like [Aricia agestis]